MLAYILAACATGGIGFAGTVTFLVPRAQSCFITYSSYIAQQLINLPPGVTGRVSADQTRIVLTATGTAPLGRTHFAPAYLVEVVELPRGDPAQTDASPCASVDEPI